MVVIITLAFAFALAFAFVATFRPSKLRCYSFFCLLVVMSLQVIQSPKPLSLVAKACIQIQSYLGKDVLNLPKPT